MSTRKTRWLSLLRDIPWPQPVYGVHVSWGQDGSPGLFIMLGRRALLIGHHYVKEGE